MLNLKAKQKIDELLNLEKKPVVIFDLDGTVFDVTFRTQKILDHFINQPDIQERYPVFVEKVKTISASHHRYGLEQTLNEVGIDRYSEHAAQFLHLAETFWFKKFFTDEYVLADKAFDGAKKCVDYFHAKGAQVVYLSGRDVPNMSMGTIKALERDGFVTHGHRVSICLKPAYGMDDYLFKKQSLESIITMGNVIATFDNEPANVQLFMDTFPEAINIHFDSQYAKHLDLKGNNFFRIKAFSELGF